jgi:hypothetical protein
VEYRHASDQVWTPKSTPRDDRLAVAQIRDDKPERSGVHVFPRYHQSHLVRKISENIGAHFVGRCKVPGRHVPRRAGEANVITAILDVPTVMAWATPRQRCFLRLWNFARRRIKPESAKIDTPSDLLSHVRHYVNDMFVLAQSHVTSFFWEDVRAFFDENDVRYNARVKLAGHTGGGFAV